MRRFGLLAMEAVSIDRTRGPGDPTRRQAILATAARLLRQYGPAKTTMADIAREARIGVGSVYLEFCSKDAIVETLSHDGHARILDAMRAASAASGTHGERLCAMFDARLALFSQLAGEGAHAGDLVHCQRTPVQRCHARFLDDQRDLLRAFLREADAAGAFAVHEPTATVDALLAAYDAFAPPRLDASCADNGVRIAALHRLVLHGLLPRAATR